MKPSLRASIIIRTKNEAARLPRVLEALFVQSTPPYEVIVVDSGSTDDTLEIARRFPVRIVHLPAAAFTFGRALNIGASLARGNVLVNLSGHAVPMDTGWLGHLLAPFKDRRVAAVGGSYVPFDDADPFDKRAGAKAEARTAPFLIPPRTSGLFGNDNCAIRRCVWCEIPFDEAVGGAEDFHWLQLVLARRWRAVHQPAATVRHSHLEAPIDIFTRYLRGAYSLESVAPCLLRHRAPVLALDSTLGAALDVLYCIQTGQSDWISYAIKRRLARAAGRFLGARPWLVAAVYGLQGALSKPVLRLTQLVGWSRTPLHPKHLVPSLDHLWILPYCRRGALVLDVGAGSGVHSLALAAWGVRVLALDYNPRGLRDALSKADDAQLFNPVIANAEKAWPVKSSGFDVVLMLDSLEHLHQPEAALAEATRALKPGGLCLATLPNRTTHWKTIRRHVGLFPFQDPDHKREYSLAEARDLLTSAGFELLAEPEPVTADLPGWSLVALVGALWPGLWQVLGAWKKRLALRFPRETTGWRFVLGRTGDPR